MKNNWTSLLALLISFIALVITFLRIDVTISNDTFIGIIASFIGACATIVVGAQLYNSIEARGLINDIKKDQKSIEIKYRDIYRQIGSIESKMEEWNGKYGEMKNMSDILKLQIERMYSNIYFIQAFAAQNDYPWDAFFTCLNSLYQAMEFKNNEVFGPCLHLLNTIVRILRKDDNYKKYELNQSVENGIVENIDKIKIHPEYENISTLFMFLEFEIKELIEKRLEN